ncbi:MAG TPA: hypothetical protein VFZ66_25140 [Herpetosiphonaceae bacterium]
MVSPARQAPNALERDHNPVYGARRSRVVPLWLVRFRSSFRWLILAAFTPLLIEQVTLLLRRRATKALEDAGARLGLARSRCVGADHLG